MVNGKLLKSVRILPEPVSGLTGTVTGAFPSTKRIEIR